LNRIPFIGEKISLVVRPESKYKSLTLFPPSVPSIDTCAVSEAGSSIHFKV
jgi:hypothetical protein